MDLLYLVGYTVLFVGTVLVAAYFMGQHAKRKKAAVQKKHQQRRDAQVGSKAARRSRVASSSDKQLNTERQHMAYSPGETVDPEEALLTWVEQQAQDAAIQEDRMAEERALLAPQLAMLAELQERPLETIAIDDIHGLLTDDSTDADLFEYISKEESDWLYGTFERLVPDELERLVESAIDGSEEDYRRALALKDAAHEHVGYNVEDHAELIKRWDRMIVRHVPDPDWDDLLGWNEYSNDAVAIYESAKNGDFFSIRLTLMLLGEDDEEVDLVEHIIDEVRETMCRALEAQRASFPE